MENNLRNTNFEKFEYATFVAENRVLKASFSWMALAMLLTSVAAYLFHAVPELSNLLGQEIEGKFRPNMLGYGVMIAPLLFVLGIGFGFNRMSMTTLVGLFVAYAVVNGISFSFIFRSYELGSIVNVFLSTTALFAVMAIAGYTTKTDLTKLGSLLMIGVIGIVIASLINFFTKSSGLDYIISILGVVIFTGLTAYDVQKIKNLSQDADGSPVAGKLGIMGALTLYLDFINLFLFLLRLFGGKKD
jgi:hypothetical protein